MVIRCQKGLRSSLHLETIERAVVPGRGRAEVAGRTLAASSLSDWGLKSEVVNVNYLQGQAN